MRKLTVDQKGGSVWLTSFLARKLKNELVRNYHNCDNRETGNWSGYLSESSQIRSEKSPGSISSLYGAKTNLKAKKNLFTTSKKISRIANGLTTQTEGVRSKIRLVFGTNYCTTTEITPRESSVVPLCRKYNTTFHKYYVLNDLYISGHRRAG